MRCSPKVELVVEGSLPRTGATPVSRTLQRSWNQHCDGPKRRRRARSQSPACMCMSAPLPGYRSTTPIVPARSPAVAVDLFVALGGRLVQMRGAQEEAKDGPALTKINRPPPTPGAEGPASGPELPAYRCRASQSLEVLRQQAYARRGRIRGDRPTTRCSRSPHIRP